MKKISLIILLTIIFNLKKSGNNDNVNVRLLDKLKNDIENAENVQTKETVEIDPDCLRDCLIKSIIHVETRGHNVHNDKEDAIGYLQIRPVMINDVNRIIGWDKYKHSDAWDKNKSIEIFMLYQDYYNPEWDLERAARIWNGGPSGDRKSATLKYWGKVQENLNFHNIQC